MAKASINTGAADQPVHTRTTGDATESQAVVIGIDGSDSVVAAHPTDGLSVNDTTGIAAAVADVVAALGGTLATDDPNTQTVLGAIEVLLTTIDVDTGGILTAVQTLDNAIAGSEMQVDVVGPLPAGTNAIGKLAANSGVDIGDVDVASIAAGTNNIGQVDPRGNVAHDAADSGNPVKVGGRARTALPAAVAQDDRVDAVRDKFGRALAVAAPLDQRVSGTLNRTNTTGADVIAAPGASVAIVVTDILVVNAHATVGTKVRVRTATTDKVVGYAGPVGGGWEKSNPDGLFVCGTNEAVTAICDTTGADVDITVSGYKIPA